MENDVIKIKKSKALLPSLLFFSFVLTALSVFCLLFPTIKKLEDETLMMLFYIVGGIGTICFCFLTFNYLFQLIFPKNAVIISEEGFLDLTMAGTGAGMIEWSNIASVKIYREEKGRVLGISLIDSSEIIADAPKKLEKMILKNIEESKPEITIKQSDITIPLNDLIETFKKHSNIGNIKENNDLSVFDETQMYDINSRTRVVNMDTGREPAAKAADREVTAPKAITKEPDIEEPVKPEQTDKTENKSIEDLLAELSNSIKQQQEKVDGEPEKDISSDIESLIKMLNDK